MARPCSVFTAATGGSASAAPATNSESRQMTKICRNCVSEKTNMTAPAIGAKRERVLGRVTIARKRHDNTCERRGLPDFLYAGSEPAVHQLRTKRQAKASRSAQRQGDERQRGFQETTDFRAVFACEHLHSPLAERSRRRPQPPKRPPHTGPGAERS